MFIWEMTAFTGSFVNIIAKDFDTALEEARKVDSRINGGRVIAQMAFGKFYRVDGKTGTIVCHVN